MSTTPRTDEAEYHPLTDNHAFVVDADFARQLERELTTANRTIQLQHIALTQIHNLTYDWADGAPDATAHDKLANEISSITHTFI